MPGFENRLVAGLPPTEPWKPQPWLVLLMPFASLSATSWIVWSLTVSARLYRESTANIAVQALADAFLALVCSGTIMIVFQLVSVRSVKPDVLRISLRTARTAVWLTPTAILLCDLTPAVLVAALALAVSSTRLMYSQWAELEGAGPGSVRLDTWLRVSAFVVALGGQTTMVAVWVGTPLLAALLLCFSAVTLTLLCLVAGVYNLGGPATSQNSLLRILLSLILAAGLTVGGRELGFNSASQPGGEPDPKVRTSNPLKKVRALIRTATTQTESGRPTELVTTLYEPSSSIEITDASYPGVILWPYVRAADSVLTAPPSPWLSSPPSSAPRARFSMRFSGQYWMFKRPQIAPPAGSYFRRASPLGLSFVTTDQKPMSMKAIQKLKHLIDLGCCRSIELTISNADRYPRTIALELLLVDTQAPGQPFQSLGKRDVLSLPKVQPLYLAAIPVTEVLDFPVPQNARIQEFDEIQVLFHRSALRIDRSALISIENFALVPQRSVTLR